MGVLGDVALLLPSVVRWARLPADSSVDEERHLAEVATAESAYEALDDAARHLGTDIPVVDRVRHEFDKRRRLLAADGSNDDPVVLHDDQYTALRLALLAQERATLVQLRDEQQIDDIVLRQVQARLDLEEVRLSRNSPVD